MSQVHGVLNGPAVYRVKVEGRIPLSWSERLLGMNITTADDGEEGTSIIVGRLPDQAALSGVLNALYDNQFAVLSVECLEKG